MTVTFQIFKLSSNQNFILLLINFIFYVIFYLLLYVPEFFFLSYFFVMFRIDFLLSIWVNLHIYIDIVFMDLVFGLKFLLIILYYIWHIKHLYFFWRKIKVTTYVFQPKDKFLFGMLYINLLNLKGFIWFWSRIWRFYKFGSFKSWSFWYLHLCRLILILYLKCFSFGFMY